MTISLYLKVHAPEPNKGPLALPRFDGRDAMRRRRGKECREEFAAVADFARTTGLLVLTTDPAQLKVTTRGAGAAFERAFGTGLHLYKSGADIFIARDGSLWLPVSLVRIVAAVLDLETTPIAESCGDGEN